MICTHYLAPGSYCAICGKDKEVLRYTSQGWVSCGPDSPPAETDCSSIPLAAASGTLCERIGSASAAPPQQSEDYTTALWKTIEQACRG